MWFGVAIFATLMGSVSVGALASTAAAAADAPKLQALASLVGTALLLWWAKCCVESKSRPADDMGGGLMHAYLCARARTPLWIHTVNRQTPPGRGDKHSPN